MSYYRICPNCGAHLDPGEKCDCLKQSAKCPLFCCRWDHGEEHSILCARADGRVTQERTFVDADARDAFYRESCCGAYTECQLHQVAALAEHGAKVPAAEVLEKLVPLPKAAQEGR